MARSANIVTWYSLIISRLSFSFTDFEDMAYRITSYRHSHNLFFDKENSIESVTEAIVVSMNANQLKTNYVTSQQLSSFLSVVSC